MQWNFLAAAGVDAPEAWGNMLADHRPGGRGVVIAVLDTGVAYRELAWVPQGRPTSAAPSSSTRTTSSPATRFPLDREGHGTFVAGMIAEATNNGRGLTGLAYGATIMPVRVLDADGNGDSVTIARGIRYAVKHGAQVINLSLEFDISVTSAADPRHHQRDQLRAPPRGRRGRRRRQRQRHRELAYPAAAPAVISVGATTATAAWPDYSNVGTQLDLVAPGGGDDATLSDDADCHPFRNLPPVHQMTFLDFNSLDPGAQPDRFGFPRQLRHLDGRARGLGDRGAGDRQPRHRAAIPTPDQILAHLEQTATPLGGRSPTRTTATAWSTPARRPRSYPAGGPGPTLA